MKHFGYHYLFFNLFDLSYVIKIKKPESFWIKILHITYILNFNTM